MSIFTLPTLGKPRGNGPKAILQLCYKLPRGDYADNLLEKQRVDYYSEGPLCFTKVKYPQIKVSLSKHQQGSAGRREWAGESRQERAKQLQKTHVIFYCVQKNDLRFKEKNLFHQNQLMFYSKNLRKLKYTTRHNANLTALCQTFLKYFYNAPQARFSNKSHMWCKSLRQ